MYNRLSHRNLLLPGLGALKIGEKNKIRNNISNIVPKMEGRVKNKSYFCTENNELKKIKVTVGKGTVQAILNGEKTSNSKISAQLHNKRLCLQNRRCKFLRERTPKTKEKQKRVIMNS